MPEEGDGPRLPEVPAGLPPWEREHRAATLAAVRLRLAEDGPHAARPDPRRASQFLPFDALEGHGDLVREQEELASEERSSLG